MHLPFPLCVLIILFCCAVESLYDKEQDDKFRLKSKSTHGMKHCTCLEVNQIEFMKSCFEELVKANQEEKNLVDLEQIKYREYGITHVFHIARDMKLSENVSITMLGESRKKYKLRLVSSMNEGKAKLPAVSARRAAVEELKRVLAKVPEFVDGSSVIEKASYFYDDRLWRCPSDISEGPYVQFAIALVRKDLEHDIRVEPSQFTPEKKSILRKFTDLFKTSQKKGRD